MIGATAVTFVATWLLHAYQWFWLHGAIPLASDGLFWGVAGVFVLVNMLWEGRGSSGSRLTPSVVSWGLALRRSLQALGIFSLVCIVWSLWCSPSLRDWAATLSHVRNVPSGQLLWFSSAGVTILFVASAAQRISLTPFGRGFVGFAQGRLVSMLGSVALALVSLAPVQAAFGPTFERTVASIKGDTLNERDQERLVASYYDRLIDHERFGGRVTEVTRLDPDDPEVFRDSPVSTPAEGPLQWELPASTEGTFHEVVVATNQWGMRDQEYTLEKAAGTFRIAILGACYEMGAGVSNHEVWEALVEERLNRELSPDTGRAYEVLNFSVAGYDLLQLVSVVREKVPRFAPDLVVVSNHVRSSVDFVLKRAKDESVWPAGLKEMVELTREEANVDWEARLESWAFGAIADTCKEIGATPVIINVPVLEALRGFVHPAIEQRIDEQVQRARVLGYEYLDLSDAFEGEAYESVAIPELQRSPSANGHRLLGEHFLEALLAHPDGLGVR